MTEKDTTILKQYTNPLSRSIQEQYAISPDHYRGDIKLGLRNNDGTGVLVGVSKVGSVQGYLMQDGQRVPAPASCTTAASSSPTSWRPTARPAPSASRR